MLVTFERLYVSSSIAQIICIPEPILIIVCKQQEILWSLQPSSSEPEIVVNLQVFESTLLQMSMCSFRCILNKAFIDHVDIHI